MWLLSGATLPSLLRSAPRSLSGWLGRGGTAAGIWPWAHTIEFADPMGFASAARKAAKGTTRTAPTTANPKMIGARVYNHEAQTRGFVNQWFTMMLRLAWVLGAAALYSTYLLVQKEGLAMTPALAFELASLAVAVATTAWLQSGGHPVSRRLCFVLVGLQVFGFASSQFNARVPQAHDESPLLAAVRDFKLDEEAFPLGAVYFAICATARAFMQKQLSAARKAVREFESIPIASVLAASEITEELKGAAAKKSD